MSSQEIREPLVYINGELYPKSEAKISVFDHGLLYGDGVFEGIRVYNGIIFKLREHVERLYRSAKVLRLSIPMDQERMVQDVVRTVRANGFRDAYIRLIVTRGVGDLGLDPRKCGRPNVIIIVEHLEPILGSGVRERGITVIFSSTRRDPVQSTSHEVKSLNYLNSILAKIEAIEAGADDAIMLDSRGFVAEATGANVFIVRSGTLFTPPATTGILPGITRGVVIEIAGQPGLPWQERDITPVEFMTADEAFVTGTGAELVPIGYVGKVPIGDGRPGPVFRRILEEFNRYKVDPRNGVPVY